MPPGVKVFPLVINNNDINLLFLVSSAPQRPPVAKVAPKLANVSARKPGMGGGDEERAELMNEVSTPP